jgi:hypothetical protein
VEPGRLPRPLPASACRASFDAPEVRQAHPRAPSRGAASPSPVPDLHARARRAQPPGKRRGGRGGTASGRRPATTTATPLAGLFGATSSTSARQQADVSGRSSMSKQQLIKALSPLMPTRTRHRRPANLGFRASVAAAPRRRLDRGRRGAPQETPRLRVRAAGADRAPCSDITDQASCGPRPARRSADTAMGASTLAVIRRRPPYGGGRLRPVRRRAAAEAEPRAAFEDLVRDCRERGAFAFLSASCALPSPTRAARRRSCRSPAAGPPGAAMPGRGPVAAARCRRRCAHGQAAAAEPAR